MSSSPRTHPTAVAADRHDLPADFPVLAVVGGGQLARMMQPAAVELGIALRVLAQAPGDSAAQVVPDVRFGAPDDLSALRGLLAGCAAVTFDHEHVPQPCLQELEQDGHTVRPGSGALIHAQDKTVMRTRLAAMGVDGPRWQAVDDAAGLQGFAERVGWPVVVKTARGGYDGKGVRVVHSAEQAADWFAAAVPLLVEEAVDFDRELAVLVARSPSGQAAAWPVVESIQRDGVCREVVAPAPGLPQDVASDAVHTALRIAGELDVVGVMAVEMFQLGDRVLVNELAMRPHNSGHWTMDGALTGQFEQHLRAVLDLPLGAVQTRAPWTVMVNVLGGDKPDLYPAYRHVMASDPGLKVHVYGKQVRPGRKVGHVTAVGDDLPDLLQRARHAADYLSGTVTE